jgi:polyisoprenoid-binding protein YceI
MKSPVACFALVALGGSIAGAPAPARETYDIDPVHSFALFKVKQVDRGFVWGRITGPMGSFVIDDADPSRSSVVVTLKTENVDTGVKERDQHLRSPDFFHAEKFPAIDFKSDSVRKSGENDYEIAGTFTLRGTAKDVVLRLRRVGAGKDAHGHFRMGFDGELTIRRREFGMTYLPEGIEDEVRIFLSIEGIRKGMRSAE